MKIKNFNQVLFGDKSNDIIPREWMIDEISCRWPPVKVRLGKSIEELAQSRVVPKPSWRTYSCQILCGASKLLIWIFNCTNNFFCL